MFTLILCAASGFISLIAIYKATVFATNDRNQSVVVLFSKSDFSSDLITISPKYESTPISSLPTSQLLISMNVSRSQVEQCVDTYCVICRNPQFINAILNYGFSWMEICVDGVMIVQMCVEESNKEITDLNKHGGSVVHN